MSASTVSTTIAPVAEFRTLFGRVIDVSPEEGYSVAFGSAGPATLTLVDGVEFDIAANTDIGSWCELLTPEPPWPPIPCYVVVNVGRSGQADVLRILEPVAPVDVDPSDVAEYEFDFDTVRLFSGGIIESTSNTVTTVEGFVLSVSSEVEISSICETDSVGSLAEYSSRFILAGLDLAIDHGSVVRIECSAEL